MSWSRWAVFVLTALGLVLGLAAPALASQPSSGGCGSSGAVTTVNGTLSDGATYEIQCPAGAWNGTLFLYSHGYVVPGSANPAEDAGDPVTASWMLSHGYALAGSSYASTGWAIQQALPDQVGTLGVFGRTYRNPSRPVAWGHSLGGIITAGLIQDYPKLFNAALPMCGVLSGGVATWNTALDSSFAFQQLGDPSVQVVNITTPTANLTGAETAAATAQQTAQGRARLALAAALADTPGWFTPLSAEPAARAFASQGTNQYEGGSRVGRARRPGRPPGWVPRVAGRAGGQRLRQPGSQPVRVGQPGDLPVRVRLPGRAGVTGRRQPVLEHRSQLRRTAGQVGRPQRGGGAVQGGRAEPVRRPEHAQSRPADQR